MHPMHSNNGVGTTLRILKSSSIGVGGNSIFRNGEGFQSKFQSITFILYWSQLQKTTKEIKL